MPADKERDNSSGAYPQYKGLLKAVEGLGFHDHLCLIYETPEEQFAAIVPFVQVGLARGEKCVYVADDNTSGEVLEQMKKGGVDTDSALATGALSVITKTEAYLKQGYFDPDWMIRFLKEAADAARVDGYTGLRVTGEMTWVLGGDPGSDRLIEYEAKLNYFFPENNALAICQYNIGRFSPQLIMDVIRTHPLVIYRGQVCRNFYYTSPEEMLLPNQSYLEVSRLLYNILERERLEELNSQSENALGRMERDFEEAERVGRTGSWEWDIETGKTNWSGGACLIFGLDPGTAPPDFKEHLRFYTHESARKLEDAIGDSLKTGQPYELDLELALPGRGGRWVIARGGVKKAPGGRVTGLRGAIIEITADKRAEMDLRSGEDPFRSIAEKIDAVFWISSIEPEKVQYVNAAFEVIWGHKREELYRNPRLWVESIHPEDRGPVMAGFEEWLSGVTDGYRAEYRVVRPDGMVKWVEARVAKIYDGKKKLVRLGGVAEDITERKEAEEAQKKINEELHHALGNVKLLSGLLPICAYCKKIRNDKGSWESLERFIRERSGAEFTHCICPECAEKFAKKDIGMA
jgi:PAS domain S-box-containing protein